MPTTNTPIFAQTLINPVAQILPADTTSYKTIRTGSTNGDRIDNLLVTSNDTVARTLAFAINDGTLDHPIGEVTIAALSGTDTAAAVKAVNILTAANFPWLNSSGTLYLQAGYILKVKSYVAVTAAKQIDIVGFGGAY